MQLVYNHDRYGDPTSMTIDTSSGADCKECSANNYVVIFSSQIPTLINFLRHHFPDQLRQVLTGSAEWRHLPWWEQHRHLRAAQDSPGNTASPTQGRVVWGWSVEDEDGNREPVGAGLGGTSERWLTCYFYLALHLGIDLGNGYNTRPLLSSVAKLEEGQSWSDEIVAELGRHGIPARFRIYSLYRYRTG